LKRSGTQSEPASPEQKTGRGRVVKPADAPLLAARSGDQVFRATLTAGTTGTSVISGGWYRIAPGVTNHLDMHPDRDEFYFIHRGSAEIVIDDEVMIMSEGDTVFVPHGTDHFIVNRSDEPFELFYVFAPAAPPHPVRRADRYPVVDFTPA
jgi:mannose-6-phosphate isomerase-like protein (cupin superfamily)